MCSSTLLPSGGEGPCSAPQRFKVAVLQLLQVSAHTVLSPCSAFESSYEALQQPTIRVVAVIAEGVPEADTKKLIAYARAHNKILLGPATVGGIQVLIATTLSHSSCSAYGRLHVKVIARPFQHKGNQETHASLMSISS